MTTKHIPVIPNAPKRINEPCPLSQSTRAQIGFMTSSSVSLDNSFFHMWITIEWNVQSLQTSTEVESAGSEILALGQFVL